MKPYKMESYYAVYVGTVLRSPCFEAADAGDALRFVHFRILLGHGVAEVTAFTIHIPTVTSHTSLIFSPKI
jgi:hypothetical protein